MSTTAIGHHIAACQGKIAGYEREIKNWRVYALRNPQKRQHAQEEIAACKSLIEREQRAINRHMNTERRLAS